MTAPRHADSNEERCVATHVLRTSKRSAVWFEAQCSYDTGHRGPHHAYGQNWNDDQ